MARRAARLSRSPELVSGFLLAAALAACGSLEARAYAGAAATEMRGGLGLSATEAGISEPLRLDVEDDFGLGDSSSSIYARAELGFGVPRLTASFMKHDASGTSTLTRTFGDILAGTQVDSEMDFLSAKAALTFDVLDFGFVRLSPGLAVAVTEFDASVRSRSFPVAESVDAFAPVPMPFVQAEVDVGPLAATVDVGYIRADIEEIDGGYLDVEALLRVQPLSHVELFAGYRLIDFEADGVVDDERFLADLRMQGVLFGVGLTF